MNPLHVCHGVGNPQHHVVGQRSGVVHHVHLDGVGKPLGESFSPDNRRDDFRPVPMIFHFLDFFRGQVGIIHDHAVRSDQGDAQSRIVRDGLIFPVPVQVEFHIILELGQYGPLVPDLIFQLIGRGLHHHGVGMGERPQQDQHDRDIDNGKDTEE